VQYLKEVLLILLIAALYFLSVYFAASALAPELLALQLALIAVIGAMIGYRVLRDQEGLPFGLLVLLPFVCVTLGVIWWIMRLVGLL